jgi:hypothetical protein
MRLGLAVVAFAALASLGAAQNSQTYLEIRLPSGVQSESVLIRYVVSGDDFGGWVKPQPGLPAYRISAIRNDALASGIKAIVYAPGCGIETLDVAFPDAGNREYLFVCHPTGSVRVSGKIAQVELLSKRDVVLQAKYLAHWASAVLGIGGKVPLTIPLGEPSALTSEGRFELSVPDFASDPGARSRLSEIQIWAIDKSDGPNVAQLFPQARPDAKTRASGLRIQRAYPAEIAFTPCTVNPPDRVLHNREGFAIRPEPRGPCER